jgi:hypothetical protein
VEIERNRARARATKDEGVKERKEERYIYGTMRTTRI